MRMKKRSYWQDNLRLVGLCLSIWFAVSFGFGILLVDVLNRIEIGGFRLGFWFAQQGSIIVFIILILVYAILLNRLDDEYSDKVGQEQITGKTEASDSAEEAGG
jgi:putative solute:sodium symporter small subunit